MSRIAHDPAGFVTALMSPAAKPPAGLVGGIETGRFEVYRNNFLGGLSAALATRFPAVRRLVGGAFFAAMAQAFARAHPPTSPLMMTYGEGFPDFLRRYRPAADLPYLADVAALEVARGHAYHAADAPALPPAHFAGLPQEALAGLVLILHPSVIVLRSPHPCHAIWAAQQPGGDAAAPEAWQPEDVLVFRAGETVALRRLEAGVALFVLRLAAGDPLGRAIGPAAAEAPGFDLAAALALLIREGLVVSSRHAAASPNA